MLLPASGTLLLLALASALGFTLSRNAGMSAPSIPIPSDAALRPPAEATALDMPPPRPDVYYAAITERPLFSPQRRPTPEPGQAPVAEPEPAAAAPAPEPVAVELTRPDLRLLGTMTGGARSTALIAQAEGEPVWLAEGDAIGGWTLSAISADSVELSRDSGSFRVDLYPQ
jgi:hypothetical protein